MFQFRPGTCDENVYQNVVAGNEYKLPDSLPAYGLVLDVGAHIGSFTKACLDRGARRIVALEPDAANFCMARKNLAVPIAAGWVTLEDLPFRQVDLLKLDCEGSEYDILQALAFLQGLGLRPVKVGSLCGEYHPWGKVQSRSRVHSLLTLAGFSEIKIEPHGDSGLGLFWAILKS